MDSNVAARLPLFGGPRAWNPSDWTSTDDRVRGGSSHSKMTCSPASLVAKFSGYLDISTLGGAGFASQRTTGEDRTWDLSAYDGLELDITSGNGKLFTITLTDEAVRKRPDGRQESAMSWEYDFRASDEPEKVFVRWGDFRPTYRGKEVEGARPLDLGGVKRFGLMVRSFFGTQEGEFYLNIVSIAALRFTYESDDGDHPEDEKDYVIVEEKPIRSSDASTTRGWMSWVGKCLGLV
ncbi:CIA30 family protein [Aspergillus alliaceus]|uniref:CIA30 family protein n=1 Tax=Petromyces alliaceus TaxID=209559 RepID=UPI0012A44C05|nr:complex I intermediate-associated protein 30-domain-containing protein [Aspergillus alliaceus]KAB8231203.1 complex I intermediate-associated protein 30-domain-containing protein [Aspergillus alliaceus]